MHRYLKPQSYFNWLKKRLAAPALSYSQTGEDLILSLFLSNDKGFYVDIGANHPRLLSNTYLFYQRGWKGINIEPNPESIVSFEHWRKRDINLNIGISSQAGTLDFYQMDESTLSTFSPEVAADYEKMGHRIRGIKKVPTKRLADVLAGHLPAEQAIDFFSIDTEGFDREVLASNDWSKYRPQFIVIETLEYKKDGSGKKLNDYYDPYFKELGYQKVADTFINTIYRREESLNL